MGRSNGPRETSQQTGPEGVREPSLLVETLSGLGETVDEGPRRVEETGGSPT